MQYSRQELVQVIQIAQQVERYQDMVTYLKLLAQTGEEFNAQERKLFSFAYKQLIQTQRTALRTLLELEPREEKKSTLFGGSPRNILVLRQYKQKLEQEVLSNCNDLMTFVELTLLPLTLQPEGKIFYKKTQADFQRYMAECTYGEAKESICKAALERYEEAFQIAKMELKATNTTRLGLALNFAVFLYELLQDIPAAMSIAKEAFEHGVNDLELVEEENHKQVTDILTILRDNLNDWRYEYEEYELQEEKSEINS